MREEADYVEEYTNMFDVIDIAAKEPIEARKRDCASRTGDKSFTGTKNIEEALDLAANGWPEGEEKIHDAYKKAWEHISRHLDGFDLVRDHQGVEVDMGAHVTGDPEDMWDMPIVEDKRETVDIVVSCSASWCVSQNSIINRGAAAISLCDALEFNDRRVALWVVRGSTGNDGKVRIVKVLVKRPEEPLNLSQVAFACGHPSMLRRIMFAEIEQQEDDRLWKNFGDYAGYGMPTDMPEKMRKEAFGENHIYIGAMRGSGAEWSEDHVIEWTLEQLKAQGVELATR